MLFPPGALPNRSYFFDQQRADVPDVILFIRNDDPATARGDENEVGMWYSQPLATVRSNFKRDKGRGSGKLANRINQHDAGR